MIDLILKKCRNYFYQPFYPITNEYCTVVLRYLWNGYFEIDHPAFRNFSIKGPERLAKAAEQTGYLEVVGKLVLDSRNRRNFLFYPDPIFRIVFASEALYIMRRWGPGFLSTQSLYSKDLIDPVPLTVCKDVLLKDLNSLPSKCDDFLIYQKFQGLSKNESFERNFFGVNNFSWYLVSLKEHIFNVIHLLLWHLQENNVDLPTSDEKRFLKYLLEEGSISSAIANLEFLYNSFGDVNLLDTNTQYRTSCLDKIHYPMYDYEDSNRCTIALLDFLKLSKDPESVDTNSPVSREEIIDKIEKKLKNNLQKIILLFLDSFEKNDIALIGKEVWFLEQCLNCEGLGNDLLLIKNAILKDNIFSRIWKF